MNKIVLAVVGLVGLMGLVGMIVSWPSSSPRSTAPAPAPAEPPPADPSPRDPEVAEAAPFDDAAAEQPWFEGGTLHQAVGADWLAAEESDQLATAADFATEAMNESGLKFGSPEAMRKQAEELVRCITAGAQSSADADVAALAGACRDEAVAPE